MCLCVCFRKWDTLSERCNQMTKTARVKVTAWLRWRVNLEFFLQENKRTVIRGVLVSQSHRLALGGCIAHICWHRRSLWRPLDNLFECPKMWLPHPLWKTQGFCAAISVTPYLLLTLEYSNTSIHCSAGFSLTFFLFVLDAVFQPSLPSLHAGIMQAISE